MARLTFPVSSGGLIVPVWIGVSSNEMLDLLATGQQVPRPVKARGQLDTGSSVTAIAASILQSLGTVPASKTRTTTTAGGQIPVRLFEVSLSIHDPAQSATAWLTEPNLQVMELTNLLPDEDVLIALDVLLTCKMDLDGPGLSFTLEL
jgi:hypothetical protein